MSLVLPDLAETNGLAHPGPDMRPFVARQKSIAVTVKLDAGRYELLKIHGVRTRRSSRNILVDALDRLLR